MAFSVLPTWTRRFAVLYIRQQHVPLVFLVKVMTGGQGYVIFWTLKPNLSSRLGQKSRSTNAATTESSQRAPESNENMSPSAAAHAENLAAETFICGVSVGKTESSSVAVTGTASGAFVVWENFECIRMVPGAHGKWRTV